MAVKTINISLDEKLLKEIDKAAKGEYTSRSHYIREVLVNRLEENTLAIRLNKLENKLNSFIELHNADLKSLSKR